MRQIELLAPAKNIECGLAAIDHGADAVYIGTTKFGARSKAGNSLRDISQLIDYAHLFGCKVYIALNTVLYNSELHEVEKLIHDLYSIHADAIIIQDMGILEMNLPPISIHASTQTNNRTVEKVKFLEETGFEQVVLARELSLNQIKNISKNAKVKLEYFIHGALCVSYSGQCYLSASINKRSANRGECAQPCRLPYTITDDNGKEIINNKHVLSLKDLNLSDYISDLIDVGIDSFKIEGRLKDVDYVKNITAYYRQKIDAIISNKSNIKKSSTGTIEVKFDADPTKSFSREFTSYFIKKRENEIWNIDSPKSLGQKIGKVLKIHSDFFTLSKDSIDLNNGDGVCFFNKQKKLVGLNINKAEGIKIIPNEMKGLYSGATIFRNKDQSFNTDLKKSHNNRTIEIELFFNQLSEKQFELVMIDEDQIKTSITKDLEFQQARNPQLAEENTKLQLSKLGGSIFRCTNITISIDSSLFFKAKDLNLIRREAIKKQQETRIKHYIPKLYYFKKTDHPYFIKQIDYRANVTNTKAKEFYIKHGVKTIENGFEVQKTPSTTELMRTKHCILFQLNKCLKQEKGIPNQLFLSNQHGKFQLEFDCDNCEMIVKNFAE